MNTIKFLVRGEYIAGMMKLPRTCTIINIEKDVNVNGIQEFMITATDSSIDLPEVDRPIRVYATILKDTEAWSWGLNKQPERIT